MDYYQSQPLRSRTHPHPLSSSSIMLNGHPSQSHTSHASHASHQSHQDGPPSNMGPLPYLPSTYGYPPADSVNTGAIPSDGDNMFTAYEDMFGGNIAVNNIEPTYEGRDGDQYYMDLLRMGGGIGNAETSHAAGSGGRGSGGSLGQNLPSASRMGEFDQMQRRDEEDGGGGSSSGALKNGCTVNWKKKKTLISPSTIIYLSCHSRSDILFIFSTLSTHLIFPYQPTQPFSPIQSPLTYPLRLVQPRTSNIPIRGSFTIS
jgi:hypothetical protein